MVTKYNLILCEPDGSKSIISSSDDLPSLVMTSLLPILLKEIDEKYSHIRVNNTKYDYLNLYQLGYTDAQFSSLYEYLTSEDGGLKYRDHQKGIYAILPGDKVMNSYVIRLSHKES